MGGHKAPPPRLPSPWGALEPGRAGDYQPCTSSRASAHHRGLWSGVPLPPRTEDPGQQAAVHTGPSVGPARLRVRVSWKKVLLSSAHPPQQVLAAAAPRDLPSAAHVYRADPSGRPGLGPCATRKADTSTRPGRAEASPHSPWFSVRGECRISRRPLSWPRLLATGLFASLSSSGPTFSGRAALGCCLWADDAAWRVESIECSDPLR